MVNSQSHLNTTSRWCRFFLIALAIFPGAASAQPDWYLNPYDTFSEDAYLVGVGSSSDTDRAKGMQIAEENARTGLIKSIRVSIKSQLIDRITQHNGTLEEFTDSRIVSSAALEVDGIQIKERNYRDHIAYAVAVLSRQEGRQLHLHKIGDLDRTLTERLDQAQQYQQANNRQHALQAYQSLYLLLNRREEAQAVLTALQAESVPPATVSRREIDAALEQLTARPFTSVDDMAATLAFQLKPHLDAPQALLVRPFTFGVTEFSSPFSQYLARTLETQLIQAGVAATSKTRHFTPKTANHLNELAQHNGTNQVLLGSYVTKGDRLRLFAQISQIKTGRKIAAAEVEIDTVLLNKERLDFRPPNFKHALSDAVDFAKNPVVDASLQIEVWTDHGAENVMLEAGDEVTLAMRVNQPCYVQMLYTLANGQRVLLYNNYHIDASRVNRIVALPDTFEVAPPLGVEVLQAFASDQQFPPVQVRQHDGYEILRDDLKNYLAQTRGLKKVTQGPEQRRLAETRLTLITVPEH